MITHEIDKPLEEKPEDLGELHKPSFEELKIWEFNGIPRYNVWCNGVLKGSNQKIYAFYLEFKPFHGSRKYVYQFDMVEIEDGKFNNIGRIDWEGWVSEEFEDKIVFSGSQGEVEYSILKEGGYKLSLNRRFMEVNMPAYGHYIGGDVQLNLDFEDLGFPFWYNKGRPAIIFSDGTKIAGAEPFSRVSGHIVIDGRKVEVVGFADHEAFFNKGDIVHNIIKHGNEFWLPFWCNDKTHGIFVIFGDYKDGGVVIDGKYMIPKRFDLTILRLHGFSPVKVNLSAETLDGSLDLTYDGIARFGWQFGEVVSKVSGIFTRKNGDITELRGFGWVEHLS